MSQCQFSSTRSVALRPSQSQQVILQIPTNSIYSLCAETERSPRVASAALKEEGGRHRLTYDFPQSQRNGQCGLVGRTDSLVDQKREFRRRPTVDMDPQWTQAHGPLIFDNRAAATREQRRPFMSMVWNKWIPRGGGEGRREGRKEGGREI